MKVSKGSLFRQGRIWWFQYRADGKRERFSLQTTVRSEAQEKMAVIQKRLDLGISPAQQARENITIRDLADKYIAFSRSTKAPTTNARDKASIEKFCAVYGHRTLAQITPKDFDDYSSRETISHHKETPLKPASLNRELTCLKAMFRKAEEWSLLSQGNPTRLMKYRRVQQRPITWLDDDAIRKVLAGTPDHLKDAVIVLLETGIRIGEFCALKKSDIDLAGRKISVTASKTYTVRYARITDALLPIMKRWVKEGVPEMPKANMLSVWIRRIGEKVGISLYPHLLRHTFASRMAQKLPLNVVQRLMGHNDIKTTLKYAHLQPGFLNSSVDAGYRY